MRICHCFCRVYHPASAQTASCARPPVPGLAVLARGPLVGPVPVPVCADCFHAHQQGEQRRGLPPR